MSIEEKGPWDDSVSLSMSIEENTLYFWCKVCLLLQIDVWKHGNMNGSLLKNPPKRVLTGVEPRVC